MRREQLLQTGWRLTDREGISRPVALPWIREPGAEAFRGPLVWETEVPWPAFDPAGERVYLEFRGMSGSVRVTVNGREVLAHRGGGTIFRADITRELLPQNRIAVTMDSLPGAAPGGNLFFRGAALLTVNRFHFDLDHFGGVGLRITPKVVQKNGKIQVRTWHNAPNGRVSVCLLDGSGKIVTMERGEDCALTIRNVRLWDGVEDPYLYTCVATLTVDGIMRDRVTASFGVRTFRMDARKGFLLNGRPYPLHGVVLPGEPFGTGEEEMALLRELGANTVRLADRDPGFYDLCDRYGLVAWAALPGMPERTPGGRRQDLNRVREILVQNHSHPCIAAWCLEDGGKNPGRELLDRLVRELDDTRPIVDGVGENGPVSRSLPPDRSELGGRLDIRRLERFHRKHPGTPLLCRYRGCPGLGDLPSGKLRRRDGTEASQAAWHEGLLQWVEKRPYFCAVFAGDLCDREAEGNRRGLVTDRGERKKDSFYLYRAYWSREKFVHICGTGLVEKSGEAAVVKVYSNSHKVTLYANGELVAQLVGDKVFRFRVPIRGELQLEAVTKYARDTVVIRG